VKIRVIRDSFFEQKVQLKPGIALDVLEGSAAILAAPSGILPDGSAAQSIVPRLDPSRLANPGFIEHF